LSVLEKKVMINYLHVHVRLGIEGFPQFIS
jgi:hypothetical protein